MGLGLFVLTGCSTPVDMGTIPRSSSSVAPPTEFGVISTLAENLEVPWGIAMLDEDSAVVAERNSGRILLIGETVRELGRIEVASDTSEGGLLGLAVDDSYLFAYYTAARDNRVVRFDFDGEQLSNQMTILSGIPRSSTHNGGRMVIGPDGYLYIGTGDAGNPDASQNNKSLAGKILRITVDGEPAPGNPFGTEVFTLGHRNVQGLAFDSSGNLWASEFGQNTVDEINLIEAGGNYGWPRVEGESDDSAFVNPLVVWSTDEASPSGIALVGDQLLVAALRGQRLWVVPITGETLGEPEAVFVGEFGRLRSVVAVNETTAWLSTSNRDGRGVPADTDDRILEITVPPRS